MSPPAAEWILTGVLISYAVPIAWGLVCSRFRTRIGLILLILPPLVWTFYISLQAYYLVTQVPSFGPQAPYVVLSILSAVGQYGPLLALGYFAGLWWKGRKKGAGIKVPLQTQG